MAKEMKVAKYTSDNIETLRFPESIRRSAGMYIGGTDDYARWVTAKECVDNSLDEALAGRNDHIGIQVTEDGAVWVSDHGHGIPQGIKKYDVKVNGKTITAKMPTMQAVFGELHTSGKFRSEAYATSIGCFVGETEIRLLNGEIITFDKLYKRWQKKQKPIPIMTWDTKKDRVAYSNISHVQLSKYTKELVDVKIGEKVIRCTPDHPFFIRTRDGIKRIWAKNLKPGMSCVAMHLREDGDGYLYSSDLKRNLGTAGQTRLHRSVYAYINPDAVIDGKDVHHANHDRVDNRPRNLELLTKKQHAIEHARDKSESGTRVMASKARRREKSRLMSSLNVDSDIIDTQQESKILTSGARALRKEGRLTKTTYSKWKSHGSGGWRKAKAFFGGRDPLVAACKRHLKYHSDREDEFKSSDDYIKSLDDGKQYDKSVAVENGRKAMFAVWSRAVHKAGIDPENLTPKTFNSLKRGVGVLGAYANLRKWTTLKEFKRALISGDEVQLHADLSEEAQEERAYEAEARVRGSQGRARIIHLFALSARRLPVITQEAYTEAKSKSTPNWQLACACLEYEHGITELDDIIDFVENYNHSVISVKKVKLKEAVPVYGMTVDSYHTYFVEPGVLVANTHGVGAKATNATAEYFRVWTYYEKQWYHIEFRKGLLKTEVCKVKKPPKLPNGVRPKKGTVIEFKHDSSIFKKTKHHGFPINYAVEWAEVMAYLNPGLEITIEYPTFKKPQRFFSKNGPKDYIKDRAAKLKADCEPKILEYKSDLIDVFIAFSSYADCDLRGFTNGSFNRDGGKHIDVTTGALYKALLDFDGSESKKKEKAKTAKTKRAKEKAKTKSFSEADIREGLLGIVNAKLHKAVFNSQDKVKLADDRMSPDLEDTLTRDFTKFFKENKALAARLREKAERMNEARSKFVASKELTSALNKVRKEGLPANYSSYDSKTKVEDRELFLCEGDSAAGGLRKMKEAYQSLLPLRGKVMNVGKAKEAAKAMASEVILNILTAIGYDPKAKDPMAKLQVGKIICVADPDPDGPFVGGTKIRCRFDNEVVADLDIADLAHKYAASGTSFEVPVFHGGREIWSPATAKLIRHVDKLVAIEAGKNKYKVDESHKFAVLVTRGLYGRETLPFPGNDDVVFIRARDMKVGDRIYCPSLNGSRDPASCDKVTKLGFQAVSKLRVQEQKEPVPVYCLEVPKYHHFVLPSGLVSSNCHINNLLFTLFYKMLPQAFDKGMVYMLKVPEFYAIYKDQFVKGPTQSAVRKALDKINAPKSVQINHAKGLGEFDPPYMKILAIDPASRELTQIKPLSGEDHKKFQPLMNEDVQARKEVLQLPGSEAMKAAKQQESKSSGTKNGKSKKLKKVKNG